MVYGTLSTNSQYQIKVHRYIQYIGSMYYFYSNNVSYDWRQSFNAAQFRSIICYAPLQHTVVENWFWAAQFFSGTKNHVSRGLAVNYLKKSEKS